MITHPHDRLLRLTSPHMKGSNVAALQRVMHEYGTFTVKKDSDIDGEYGPATARAVKQTKYLLGYPKKSVDMVAGDHLYGLLVGTIKPTKEMLALSRARKPTPHHATLGERMLAAFEKEIGYKESPAGSNNNKFGAWYGVNHEPWCAMSVSKIGVDCGSKAFKRGVRYSYVPTMVADARAHHNYLTITYDPQPGDPTCFDWPGESRGIADHVGLFGGWINRNAGTFWTVEGNTSYGNNSNGGEVMKRYDRNKSEVQAFIHVLQ